MITVQTYQMHDPQMGMVQLTQDTHWADWQHTDLAATLDIFQSNKLTQHTTPVGSAKEDEPPLTTTGFSDNDLNQILWHLLMKWGGMS